MKKESLSTAKDRICLALDMLNEDEILRTVEQMHEFIGYFKVNFAFTRFGPNLIEKILKYNVKIFLDLKMHDIPNTVSGYVEAVTNLGVHIVTVHTSGGMDMMRAIAETAKNVAFNTDKVPPKFIGVTLLTNIDKQILNNELKISGEIKEEVIRRVHMAMDSGLNGIVCSPAELLEIKNEIPDNCFCITPGVRAAKSNIDDHKRVASFGDAIKAGSSLLVVGRDLLLSNSPIDYAKSIIDEIMKGE
jgi:orotidine-5'-phosphate decarboxylase